MIPVETVHQGDRITVTKPYKDITQTLTGVVHRVLPEGRARTLYTADGVELARYVIGRKSGVTVELLKPVDPGHTMLEVFESAVSA